jgi:hypothetical protein
MRKRNSGATGPTSPTGKATSSENSTTHGCRSQRLLVKGERQEDLDALRDKWRKILVPQEYQQTHLGLNLMVDEVIRADWMLERTRRNETRVQEHLAEKDPLEWDKADHDKAHLFARYVRAAENTLNRALRAFREMQKHDAYLRDREEKRCHNLTKDLENELIRVAKCHVTTDFREDEARIQQHREWVLDKYSHLDDYLDETPEDLTFPGERPLPPPTSNEHR